MIERGRGHTASTPDRLQYGHKAAQTVERARGICRKPGGIPSGRNGHTASGFACKAGRIVTPLPHAVGRCCGIACRAGRPRDRITNG